MQLDDVLAAYLAVQQALLNCTDHDQLIPTVVKVAKAELAKLGYEYEFINAIIFDKQGVVQKSILAEGNTDTTEKHIIDYEHILHDPKVLDLLKAQHLAVTGPRGVIDTQHFVSVNSLLLGPVGFAHALSGILVFGSKEKPEEVHETEKLITAILANKMASVYRLQDTQASNLAIAQEVYTMNAQLHQLDKLKDDFVSVASHELRTPMTAIKSYLWMALNKRKQELSPEVHKYLDKAYMSVDRLINLVNDMLNVSRIEGGRIALALAPTDLVALAREVQEEVAVKASEKQLHVVVEPSDVPQVLCDKDKIREVYLNFVGNSLKFTPPNGTITIRFKKLDDQVEVAVTDSGRGIAKEDLPRLFAKFGRLNNSYVAMAESSGTGLGLYISKSLIEIHKGHVAGNSDGVNMGSTFSFSLPIAGTELAKKLENEAPKPAGDVKGLEKTAI